MAMTKKQGNLAKLGVVAGITALQFTPAGVIGDVGMLGEAAWGAGTWVAGDVAQHYADKAIDKNTKGVKDNKSKDKKSDKDSKSASTDDTKKASDDAAISQKSKDASTATTTDVQTASTKNKSIAKSGATFDSSISKLVVGTILSVLGGKALLNSRGRSTSSTLKKMDSDSKVLSSTTSKVLGKTASAQRSNAKEVTI